MGLFSIFSVVFRVFSIKNSYHLLAPSSPPPFSQLMPASTISIALGTFMAICALCSITLNLLTIYIILIGGFVRSRENSIYILSLLNLVIDCAHATFVFVYLVPASIAQVGFLQKERRFNAVAFEKFWGF